MVGISPQSTSRSVCLRHFRKEGSCPFFLKTCLTWRPNEEERDHDADNGQYGDGIEHCHITADEISQLPRKKVSHNLSGPESGKEKPVIRPVVLDATCLLYTSDAADE